jgi:3-oxoacyl-[acyl-carrier protein] reductase
MTVSLSLDNRVALITGGSRGIGAAAVRMFVAAGARVVFSYEKSEQQAAALVLELGKERCAAVQCNLTGTGTAEKLVGEAVRRFEGLDILVVNHGVWESQDIAVNQMADSQWRKTVAVNLDSAFALIKHSVEHMKRQGKRDGASRHIVLVSSTAGQRGEAFHCDYAATKGALISMVKGLSTELASDRIYVNCVAPGWVETDMSAPVLANSETRAKIFEKIPLGRVAKAEEIAAPILFLCTPAAGFITGEILNVNGGAVLVG